MVPKICISEMHPMIATDLSPAAIDHGNNFSIWIALIIEFAWTLEMTVKWHAPVFVNLLAILLQRPGLIAAFLLPRPRKPIAIAAISIQPVVVEPMPWTLAYRREWHEYRNCGRRDLDHRMRLRVAISWSDVMIQTWYHRRILGTLPTKLGFHGEFPPTFFPLYRGVSDIHALSLITAKVK